MPYNTKTIDQKAKELHKQMNRFPVVAKDIGVQFFKSRFREQGWRDEGFEPWQKRKKVDKKRPGRAILINRGRLVNSITGEVSGADVIFHSNTPYSKVHNEGGIINHPGGEQAMAFKTFTRGKYKGRTLFSKNNKGATFGRKVTAGPYTIKMPKRQFMGDSRHLRRVLSRKLETTVSKVFSN